LLIGIDKVKSLNPLKAAASGAKGMERWLRLDGYETRLVTDEHGDVSIGDLKKEVRQLVESNQFEKLVIYFAGHGSMSGSNEIWLLSNAVGDADEVVDVGRSADDSRRGGIKSVIFISDACRTVPQSLAQSRMTGGTLFPNGEDRLEVEVDRFFATRPGDAALEIALASQGQSSVMENYVGAFTDALQKIHVDPPKSLVGTAEVDGSMGAVVLSRRLRNVLPSLVNERVQDVKLSLRQQPQLRLECGDDGYVAKPIFTKGLGSNRRRSSPVNLVLEDAAAERENQLGAITIPGLEVVLENASDLKRFEAYSETFTVLHQNAFAPSRPGATIYGRPVRSIWSSRFAELKSSTEIEAAITLNVGVTRPVSVTVQFWDGSGAVLALLPDYHLTVKVGDSGIAQMTYARTNPTCEDYYNAFVADEIRALRAQASAAVNMGLFPMDRPQVLEFSHAIRRWKKIDPTLGLYAAIGYAEVGLKSQLHSVLEYMSSDIKGHLLDLIILSRSRRRGGGVAPFCPMLSQTWAHLENSLMKCPGKIMEAGRHRQQSPWTTFTPEGMKVLREAYKDGELGWINW
jgi:hypothetical protein